MKWKIPPVIKIYEALGSLGDGRITVDGTTAKVYSSSGNKFYDVTYDPEQRAIVTNDNGSYWQKYLGYPAICFLLATGVITYDKKWDEALKGFHWKDINTKFKNDFDKTANYIREELVTRGYDLTEFDAELANIMDQIKALDLAILGSIPKPPSGY